MATTFIYHTPLNPINGGANNITTFDNSYNYTLQVPPEAISVEITAVGGGGGGTIVNGGLSIGGRGGSVNVSYPLTSVKFTELNISLGGGGGAGTIFNGCCGGGYTQVFSSILNNSLNVISGGGGGGAGMNSSNNNANGGGDAGGPAGSGVSANNGGYNFGGFGGNSDGNGTGGGGGGSYTDINARGGNGDSFGLPGNTDSTMSFLGGGGGSAGPTFGSGTSTQGSHQSAFLNVAQILKNTSPRLAGTTLYVNKPLNAYGSYNGAPGGSRAPPRNTF